MYKLFIDFDNTITIGDVGDALFQTFGDQICGYYERQYRAERLSSKSCIRGKCVACSPIDKTAMDALVDSQSIDPSFPAFIQFCWDRALDCTIVSDGFDYYIKRILHRHGLGLPFFANALTLQPVDRGSMVRLVPLFPYDDEECTLCACCKRNVMLTRSGDEDILVYVGDGYSDRCPVPYADIIFAKAELQTYCQQVNISYFEYRTFYDVQQRMEQLLQRKSLHKRRAAEAKRHALFLAE